MSVWRQCFNREVSLRDNFARTPKELYRQLDDYYHFDFDPCPVEPTFDGLSVPWGLRNYANPPYNDLERWIQKAFYEASQSKLVVMLLPVRTNRRYWHQFILPHAQVYYLQGHLRFEPYSRDAPFAMCLAVFDFSERMGDDAGAQKQHPAFLQ